MNGRVTMADYEEAANLLGVKMVQEMIEPGDLYLAGRNTGPHLLTCERVNTGGSWIHSVEPAYSFDVWECFKVVPK